MEVSTFFTRLLQAPKATAPPPPDNLDDFDDARTDLFDTLEHPDERQLARGVLATGIPLQLKRIVDALVYEGNRGEEDATGPCLEYFLRRGMLDRLEGAVEGDRPRGVKSEVLKAVNNLVVLMSERFLLHNAVHRPLRRLIRSCAGDAPATVKLDGSARVVGAAAMDQDMDDEETEENLVDLLCILCSRMRAYPPLLLIFCHDRGWLPTDIATDESTTDDPATHFGFLLFSYLLRYVHRDGRTGDYARAGLLFLFDIAFLAPGDEGGDTLASTPGVDGVDPLQESRGALAEYVLRGDFASVMAAGLGAVFSVLPSTLRVPTLAERGDEGGGEGGDGGGLAVGGGRGGGGSGADSEVSSVYSLVESSDELVRSQLDLLLKLFGFVEDMLYRCRSPSAFGEPTPAMVTGAAVAAATLDALQTAFVDNVLYPSILECSPSDGSAVAVLTYLDVMVANLEDGPVLHRILDVLMDAEDKSGQGVVSDSLGRYDTGAMEYVPSSPTKPIYYATEGRFTLRDLILDNLKSTSAPSRAAALHLLQTLLSDHCARVAPSLLSVVRDPHATALARNPLPPPGTSTSDWPSILPLPVNSPDVHRQEPELYSALVPRLDDAIQTSETGTSGFAPYLADAHAMLQADRCWLACRVPLQFISDDGKPALLRVGEFDASPMQHALSPLDGVVRALLAALGGWFTSPPDTNVALTGALAALVRCPNRSLAGWLLYDARKADDEVTEDGTPRARGAAALHVPAVYQVLRELTRHVGRFRGTVGDFEGLLQRRRRRLLAIEEEEVVESFPFPIPGDGDASTPVTAPAPAPSTPVMPSPGRKVSLGAGINTIKSFWSSPRKGSLFGSGTPTGGTPPRVVSPNPGEQRLGQGQSGEGSPSPSPFLSPPVRRVEGEVEKKTSPLSAVLDNCIILEELVKEIVAVVIARRALGVDQVGFV